MGDRFHRFSYQMAGMTADRLTQPFIERRRMGDGQRMSPVPLGNALRALLRDAGFTGHQVRPLPYCGFQVFLKRRRRKKVGRFRNA